MIRDLLTSWVPYFWVLGWAGWTLWSELRKQRRERLRREVERENLWP
ncbi:hypothetical protein ACFT5B_14125 [Luteimicrobium sp. NPDC057192]